MENGKIDVKIKGLETIDIDEAAHFQQELKIITPEEIKKLKTSILKYGYRFPLFLWRSGGKTKKSWLIDGHQRIKALKELREEGYEVPGIPYVEIPARTRNQAKEILLVATSRYGKTTIKGFDSFIEGLDLDNLVSMVSFPEIKVEDIKMPEFAPVGIEEQGKLDEVTIKNITCPKCGHEFGL